MEFVLKIVFALLLVGVAALVAHIVDKVRGGVVPSDRMSFRETMDLTGLPIVTFKQGENKINFILDTGAAASLVDKKVLDFIKYTELEGNKKTFGVDGNVHVMQQIGIVLSYKGKDYPEVFTVHDMSVSFGRMKSEYGVTIHGLLSSTFFERYKYILDFKELAAYSKA